MIIKIIVVFLINGFEVWSQDCTTQDGRICIFPFNYNDINFNKCTNFESNTAFWCATKVNDDMVLGNDPKVIEYGYCNQDCEREVFISTTTTSKPNPTTPQLTTTTPLNSTMSTTDPTTPQVTTTTPLSSTMSTTGSIKEIMEDLYFCSNKMVCKDPYGCLDDSVRKKCPRTCGICKTCYDFTYGCEFENCNLDAYVSPCKKTCKVCDLACRDMIPTIACEYFKKKNSMNDNLKKWCSLTFGTCSRVLSDIYDKNYCQKMKAKGYCTAMNEYHLRQYCHATCNS